MRSVVAVSVLVACSRSTEPITVAVDAGYDRALVSDGAVPYQAFGTFAVVVSAQIEDPDGDAHARPRTPLRAIALIDRLSAVAGSTTNVTMSLVPDLKTGTYSGAGTLVWPPGGVVPIRVTVSGAAEPFSFDVPLVVPRIGILHNAGSQNGSTATIDACVVSSTKTGSVAVHLERGTFAGTSSATDQTLALVTGPCDVVGAMPAVDFEVASHAPFSITTSFEAVTASATLTGPANSPPLDVIAPMSILAPTIQSTPIVLTFTPLPSNAIFAGMIVTVEVATTPVRRAVPITFQTSPEIDLVPPMAITDANGRARTSFAMPSLGGGQLVIGAFGGNTSQTLILTN